jgi:Flp pilus assembly protein TadG
LFDFPFLRYVSGAARPLLASASGTVAVELALLAPVFLAMVFGILEIGFVMSTNAVMDGAARDAARQIRTGQAQLSGDPVGAFKTALCTELTGYIACGDLVFDVRSFATFSAVALPPIYDAAGAPQTQFTPGGPGQIVAARISYRYRFIAPLVGRMFSTDGSNSILLTSTVVFKNEPYSG